ADLLVRLTRLRWLSTISDLATSRSLAKRAARRARGAVSARYLVTVRLLSPGEAKYIVSLVDAASGVSLWSKHCAGSHLGRTPGPDELDVIVAYLTREIETAEFQRSRWKSFTELKVSELIARAQALIKTLMQEDLLAAGFLLERALEADPFSAPAHTQMGYC